MTKDEALKMALEAFAQYMPYQLNEKERIAKETIDKVLAQPAVTESHGRTMNFESDHGVVAPQRTWVGLTKEEIAEFDTWHDHREEEGGWCNPSEIVAYIEAKLRSKNNV